MEKIPGDLRYTMNCPPNGFKRQFPLLNIRGHDTACSGCTIPLFSSLGKLADQGKTFKDPFTIILGKENCTEDSPTTCVIGNCSSDKLKKDKTVKGCPPDMDDIFNTLSEYVQDK